MNLTDSVIFVLLMAAIAGLIWNVASVLEARRVTRRHRTPFRLRIVFRRPRPSNVIQFRRG